MDEQAFNSGPNFTSKFREMGSELNQNQNQNQQENAGGVLRAEVDTSAPFESVMEAVTRFGGIGFWKPHIHNPSQPSKTNTEEEEEEEDEAFDSAKVEAEATQLQSNLVAEEKETREILKEIEATKTRFEELKVKLQKEEVKVKVNTHPSDDQNNENENDSAKVEVEEETELSKSEILNRVDDATKEVKACTRVIEEALSRVEAARHDSCGTYSDCNVIMSGPTMSIGQILSQKLVLAKANSEKSSVRWKVSLAQILNKGSSNGEKRGSGGGGEKGVSAKRMKFGFGGMKKTKKQSRT